MSRNTSRLCHEVPDRIVAFIGVRPRGGYRGTPVISPFRKPADRVLAGSHQWLV
ncbi:hypothetical protein [Actinopolymorpha pittospori]